LVCLEKFSALMTSSERDDYADVSRDQIQRLLGRTRDTEPSRGLKSHMDVDIQLSDAIVDDVVNRRNYFYNNYNYIIII